MNGGEYLTQDKGIVKLVLTPSDGKIPTWTRGSNALFHYTVYAYLSPESTSPVSDDVEHNHTHGESGCCGHSHGHHHHGHGKSEHLEKMKNLIEGLLSPDKSQTATKQEKQSHPEPSLDPSVKPVRTLVSTSKDLLENGSPFELRIGYQFSVKAFETCVKSMRIGERARFLCMPEYVEGFVSLETLLRQERTNRINLKKGLPPVRYTGCAAQVSADSLKDTQDLARLHGVPLELDIQLLSVQEPGSAGFVKEPWEMTPEERYEEVPELKNQGGALYREGNVKDALAKYERALAMIESLFKCETVLDLQKERMDTARGIPIDDSDGVKTSIRLDELEEWNKSLRLNYAACKLKLHEYDSVIIQCTEVLKLDSGSLKGLFRRAQAYIAKGRDLDLAGKDLMAMQNLFAKDQQRFPEGCAERQELSREQEKLNKLLKLHVAKEKKMYGGMFSS